MRPLPPFRSLAITFAVISIVCAVLLFSCEMLLITAPPEVSRPINIPVIRSQTSTSCDGETHAISLTTTPVVINPSARCILQWAVVRGRVTLIGPTGEVEVGTEGGAFPNHWTESVRASKDTAEFRYRKIASDKP